MLKINTMEMRQSLGEILNRVALRHDHFSIERKGKPLAVMLPASQYEAYSRISKDFLLSWFDANKLSQKKADNLADEAKHKARPKKIKS